MLSATLWELSGYLIYNADQALLDGWVVDENSCMRQDSTSPRERRLVSSFEKAHVHGPCFERDKGREIDKQRRAQLQSFDSQNCSTTIVHRHGDDSGIRQP